MSDPIIPPSSTGPAAPGPDDASMPPSASGAPTPGPVTFTVDQLDALGLADCQDGDTYTVTVTKTGSDETGSTFEVSNTEPAEPGADAGGMPGEEGAESATASMPENPDAAPGSELADEDSNPDAQSKILGYARKKKRPAPVTPDTKNMRDI